MTRRLAILCACLGTCLILIVLWVARTARPPTGGLSVTFVGLTNNNSGGMLARFDVTNEYSRGVRFGVGEVQIRQTNGWPNSMRVAGGAEWLAVAAGSHRVFSVPVPSPEETVWRVPLIYSVNLTFGEELRFRLDGIVWSMPQWRPGQPGPVLFGDPYHRKAFVDGPEMLGFTNRQVK